MNEFNYSLAHAQLITPQLAKIAPALVEAVREIAGTDKTQGRDLNIPVSDRFKELLAPFTSQELSEAAYVANNLTHWGSAKSPCPFPNFCGWKASNVINSILCERHGIKRDSHSYGFSIYAVDGALRVNYTSSHSSAWKIVGAVTEENISAARAILRGYKCRPSFRNDDYKACEALKAVKAALIANQSEFIQLAVYAGALWGEGCDAPQALHDVVSAMPAPAPYVANVKAEADKKQAAAIASELARFRKTEAEHVNRMWVIENCFKFDRNAIFYKPGEVTFGWREALSIADISEIKELTKRAPFEVLFKEVK